MFDKTRIVWGVALVVAVIFIALIDSFWLNLIIFGAILYIAFDEAKRLFNTPSANVFFALLALVFASISKEPLACGAGLLLLVVGALVYKKAKNLKEALKEIGMENDTISLMVDVSSLEEVKYYYSVFGWKISSENHL